MMVDGVVNLAPEDREAEWESFSNLYICQELMATSGVGPWRVIRE